MDDYKRQLFAAHPVAAKLESALRNNQNRTPLFFFHEIAGDADLRGCWAVLGRLGPQLEKSFSIRGEVLMLFSPYEDFQRRSFNALMSRARLEVEKRQVELFGHVRFTPDRHIAFIATTDPSAAANLAAWNSEGGSTLVALLPKWNGGQKSFLDDLTQAVGEVIASRDLYRGRNPVTGDDFFGRAEMLRVLTAELGSGRSVGLFGLRRSGKTSLLREMKRRFEPSGAIVIQTDLEALESLSEIPRQLAEDLVNALRSAKDEGRDVWIGSESEQGAESFNALASRLTRVAAKNADFSFVFAVDEIEHLKRLANDSSGDVRTFLACLRRASQTSSNLALFFTGVTTAFFERSLLAEGVDNPLFGFVDSYFLSPFSLNDTVDLLRDLGNSMFLTWQDEALDRVHQEAGGFPFLVRDLASKVRRDALSDPDPRVARRS